MVLVLLYVVGAGRNDELFLKIFLLFAGKGKNGYVSWSVPKFILVTNLTFGALPPLFYWRRKKKFLLFFLSHVDNVFFSKYICSRKGQRQMGNAFLPAQQRADPISDVTVTFIHRYQVKVWHFCIHILMNFGLIKADYCLPHQGSSKTIMVFISHSLFANEQVLIYCFISTYIRTSELITSLQAMQSGTNTTTLSAYLHYII